MMTNPHIMNKMYKIFDTFGILHLVTQANAFSATPEALTTSFLKVIFHALYFGTDAKCWNLNSAASFT